MQQKVHQLLAASFLMLSSFGAAHAQTISTFEDVVLPGADTDFITSQATPGDYTFQSGNITFFGTLEPWLGYDHFNCTNYVDTTNPSYTNDRAAITGKGYNNSTNYGVAYVDQDYPAHPYQSILIGAKLQGTAAGSKVIGTYLTNTTYAYLYMKDNYHTGDSMSLVIRGYLNSVPSSDSVVFNLAKYTSTDTVLVKDWQWVNLLPLGSVDSLSFQIFSSDEYAPYYFAFDNLTTLDGACPHASTITASNITQNTASINWTGSINNLSTNYDIAIDQTATLAPTATTVNVTALTYAAAGLTANTQYYAHIRAICPDGGTATWDTVGFKTQQGTGINEHYKNDLNIVISPNPAQNFINLNVTVPVSASIYSLEGKLLMTVCGKDQINISALSVGTYFVRVTDMNDNSKQATLRFTKNH